MEDLCLLSVVRHGLKSASDRIWKGVIESFMHSLDEEANVGMLNALSATQDGQNQSSLSEHRAKENSVTY